jgi:hypothetical protein
LLNDARICRTSGEKCKRGTELILTVRLHAPK